MARKRNYKAEYAAQKKRATDAGYSSAREYKSARKAMGLGRARASVIPKRIARIITPGIAQSLTTVRKENAEWSANHSRMPTSKWRNDMPDEKALRYNNAFVHYSGLPDPDKLRRLYDYLVYYGLVTEDEWRQNYLGIV